MQDIKAWAVVVKDTALVPYTSAPEILGAGCIYQIYRHASDAHAFCHVKFADSRYEVVPCVIKLGKKPV